MADDYKVPFSVDGTPFFKELDDMAAGAINLGNKVDESAKKMQNAFNTAASASEKLNDKIKVTGANLDTMRPIAEKAGREISAALSGKGIDDKFKTKVEAIKATLKSIAFNTVYLDVNFDNKKIQVLESEIKKASTAQEEFNTVIEFGKQQLAGMEAGGQNYLQLSKHINDAELLVNELGSSINKVIPESERLADAFDELMGDPGRFLTTKELEKMDKGIEEATTQASRLEVSLNAVSAAMQKLDPNSEQYAELNKILETGKEAMTAYGSEFVVVAGKEEEVIQKTVTLRTELLNVKNQMAEMLASGNGGTEAFDALASRAAELQTNVNNANKEVKNLSSNTQLLDAGISALQGLAGGFAAAQGAAALFGADSEEAEKVIQKVAGAMAVLQGVQAVSNALTKEGSLMITIQNALRTRQVVATTAATGAQVANAAATTAVTGATGAATAAVNLFTASLLANPITAIIVAILAAAVALWTFMSNTDDAEEATTKFNDALARQNQLLEMDEASLKRRSDLTLAYAKAQGASETVIRDLEAGTLKDRLKLREDFHNEQAKEYDRAVKEGLVNAEDLKKLGDDLLKSENAVADARNAVQIKELNDQTASNKEREALLKKRNDDAKKAAEEARKVNSQLNKYIKETADAEIAAMKDGFEKERAEARSQAKVRVDALNTEVSLSKAAAEQKAKLIAAINSNLNSELQKIDIEEAKKRATLQMEANSIMADLREEGLKKELAALGSEYESKVSQINENFKDEEELRGRLLEALYNSTQKRREQIIRDNAGKSLDVEEESEIVGLELMYSFGVKSAEAEEAKQLEILKIQLKYAQIRLANIIDDGSAEAALAKKQAALVVSNLSNAIGDVEIKQGAKKFDWFKFLGFDANISDEQKAAVVKGMQQGVDAVVELTNFMVEQYQRQIDKKQEVIDKYDDELDDLEDRLDKEKALREKGFANNVELLEAEIDEKKRAREEELKQQEELQKKQAALQKLQLMVDTGIQASNMITAATSIFKSFAVIPFGLGLPLAIGVVAAMTGAFVASKVKAVQAINDGAKMGKGGLVDGKPHSQGGKKYIAQDGTGRVVELEAGEMVINKRDSAKHMDVLTAINEGKLHELSDQTLANFLAGTGVVMNSDAPKKAIHEVKQRNENRVAVISIGGDSKSGELESISEDVKYLATKAKNEIVRWEDDKYIYEKKGNTTTKTRKK